MNKTVLGIMGFLLLAPGLVLLGTGGIIVGFLMCVTGAGLLTLAIRPEWFKRYLVTIAILIFVVVAGFITLLFSGSKREVPQVETVQPIQQVLHHS